jgi:hypothetical protein
MVKLENDYTTLEWTIKLSWQETLAHGSTILELAIALNMQTNLIYLGLWPRFRPFPPPVLSLRGGIRD